jgi:hypothetical protein
MDHEIERKLEDLTEVVGSLADEVKAMRDQGSQYVTHRDLSAYLTVAAFETRMERMTVDILSKVTKTMQAMFNDAVKEATTIAIESYTETDEGKQWFREALAEDRALARKERVDDFRKVMTTGRAIVLWVIPIVTLFSTLGQILGWW